MQLLWRGAAAHHNDDAVVECLQKMVPGYHPNRKVRSDHTVVAVTGNTELFSKEELARQLELHTAGADAGAQQDPAPQPGKED